MTLTIRRSADRGHADHGWLDARHSFSFAGYFDPEHVQFGPLRVLNEDRVAPGQGFGSHPHENMEIITVILDGALEHKDSMGTGSVIRPGDVQVMSAGKGVVHSEFNASRTDPVHLVQIWILPRTAGGSPRYDERSFDFDAYGEEPVLIASGMPGDDDTLMIQADARMYRARPAAGQAQRIALLDGDRGAWIQVLRGSVTVDGATLNAGDGASLNAGDGASLREAAEVNVIGADDAADVLVFDLPMMREDA